MMPMKGDEELHNAVMHARALAVLLEAAKADVEDDFDFLGLARVDVLREEMAEARLKIAAAKRARDIPSAA